MQALSPPDSSSVAACDERTSAATASVTDFERATRQLSAALGSAVGRRNSDPVRLTGHFSPQTIVNAKSHPDLPETAWHGGTQNIRPRGSDDPLHSPPHLVAVAPPVISVFGPAAGICGVRLGCTNSFWPNHFRRDREPGDGSTAAVVRPPDRMSVAPVYDGAFHGTHPGNSARDEVDRLTRDSPTENQMYRGLLGPNDTRHRPLKVSSR